VSARRHLWLAALLGVACGDPGWRWDLPAGFPPPEVPPDNPMSAKKVELGRRLFYDTRLSDNGTQACATCHVQALAFTDGRARGLGSTGQTHPRGPMGLVNIAYASTLGWANPILQTLEAQALVPMFGEDPVELGLAGKEEELLERLRGQPKYQELFPAAFPADGDPYSVANVTRAIAAFERTILSARSPFDRWQAGDEGAVSAEAKRGHQLFFSEDMECFHCHGGFNFSDATTHEGKKFAEIIFHNTGLYNLGGSGAYPSESPGVIEITLRADDMGKFKAPSLRNIAVTAPYMHDGSIGTLSEVLDHYALGGRTIPDGPNAGVGAANRYKSGFIHSFPLSGDDRRALLAFLESLTDPEVLVDPRFADPWKE
jgi:cytochrome c peroxidase